MYTKKSLGQHFLKEPVFAERLAEGISSGTRNIVEIGPGTGMLTQHLVGRCDRLLLVEKDTLLAHQETERWADEPSVHVVEADILNFDLAAFFGDEEFTIVGNFPYNISSQILLMALALWERVPEFIGMFQYEVARRIVSGPGSKEYGILSVLSAARFSGKLLFSVPPGAFNPPPKVRSAVIRLTRKEGFSLPCAFASLQTVVRAAFGQRRKMMRNSLKPFLPDTILAGSLYRQRPEQLGLAEFIDIALIYESQIAQLNKQ
jgi:16S rRNA (adenine1518-N6/adenine1519-N6)-dimethyltransferase